MDIAPVLPPPRHPAGPPSLLLLLLGALIIAGIAIAFLFIKLQKPGISFSPPTGAVQLFGTQGGAYEFSYTNKGASLTSSPSTSTPVIMRADGVSATTRFTVKGPVLEITLVGSSTPRAAGIGVPLAVLPNGAFLVATLQGIQAIDPYHLSTTTLVANASMLAAALGSRIAAVSRAGGFINIYGLASTSRISALEYTIGIASTSSFTTLGFDGPDYLIAETAPDNLGQVYYLPEGSQKTLVHMIRFPLSTTTAP